MNSATPHVRATEMVASPLESFGGQRHSTETYTRARELRRWIAEHPGKRAIEMPADLRTYLEFLVKKKLVTWKGVKGRTYFVRAMV